VKFHHATATADSLYFSKPLYFGGQKFCLHACSIAWASSPLLHASYTYPRRPFCCNISLLSALHSRLPVYLGGCLSPGRFVFFSILTSGQAEVKDGFIGFVLLSPQLLPYSAFACAKLMAILSSTVAGGEETVNSIVLRVCALRTASFALPLLWSGGASLPAWQVSACLLWWWATNLRFLQRTGERRAAGISARFPREADDRYLPVLPSGACRRGCLCCVL